MANLATIDQNILADSGIDPIDFITGTGIAGQVTYWSGTTGITGSNNLLWDSVANRFTVGGSAYISGTSYFSSASGITSYSGFSTLNVVNDGPASIAIDRFSNNATSPHFNLRKSRGTVAAPLIVNTSDELGYVGFWGHDGTSFQRNAIILVQAANVTGTTITPVMRFGLGTSAPNNQYHISLFNTGNTLLGPSATADDTVNRLQVIGNAKIVGSGNTSASIALTVQNSDSTVLFRIKNEGGFNLSGSNGLFFSMFTTSGGIASINGTNTQFYNYTTTQAATSGAFLFTGDNFSQTSGTNHLILINKGFTPTSGTSTLSYLTITPTINQTGGANGITRGLYVNPTLTAAADWRSIEWSNATGWGLYGAGAAPNYLAGRLQIGNTTSTGETLQVTGTMRVTGATTFGGNLVIPIGSYDAPSLSFVNDSNTGLYSPLADNLELKTGTNNAVLLENQGVNLMQYSEEIGSFPTNFQQISCTIPGNVVAPDGKTNASIAIPDTSLNQHRLYRGYTISGPNTASVYAKSAGYNFISLAATGGTAGETIIFDIVNGTISGTSGTHTASIENVGNGWFRCSLTSTSVTAPTLFSRWIIVRNANSTASYSGDGTSGVYLWGWQIEENTAATSYIRTSATAVTRPQAVSILGANLYGNLITGKVSAPSLNDLALTTDYTDRLIVKSTTGNVLVGLNTDSTTEKLQVAGNARVVGSGNTSASTALTVQNSSSQNAFRILNNGQINVGNSASLPVIRTVTEASVSVQDIAGTKLLFVSADTETGSNPSFRFDSNTLIHTSGNLTFSQFSRDFIPTSGTGTVTTLRIAGSINQTGGANGITRGLYVNPNLVAAADWRSIEWSNNTGWGLYGVGTALNFLSGNLGIGDLAITATKLFVRGTSTGSTSAYGFRQESTFASDVTSLAVGYFNRVNQASGTLAEYSAFKSQINNINGTITDLISFNAQVVGAATNATNFYGFYGNIASGTGRWNLYMNGTANNYMAGSLNIGGVSSVGIASLIVQKTIAGTGGTVGYGVLQQGVVQSTITSFSMGFYNQLVTAAASFNLPIYYHYFAQQGTIGAGSTVGDQYGFAVDATFTGATNNYGFYGAITAGTGRWNLYMGGTANNYLGGRLAIGSTNFSSSVLAVKANLTGTISQAGVLQSGTVLSDVTNTVRGFLNQLNTQAAAFSLFEYYHFDATQGVIGASSSVSNQYGFRAADSLTGATNNYGFYGDIASGTGRWNIYMNGTADNYIAGKLGIGSTTLTANTLRISRAQTGATSINTVLSSGQINSDVTASVNNFASQLITQAATFTLGSYSHFRASDALKGAGSTITNEFGFNVDDLTFGTNNFGFYGNIAAATGRWNIYMNGTALNYLNGNLLIGDTNNTGEKLQVNGDAKITGKFISSSTATTAVNGDYGLYSLKTFTQASAISNTNLYGFVSSVIFDLTNGAYSGSNTYNATSILSLSSIAGNTTTQSTQPIRSIMAGLVGKLSSAAMNIADFRYFEAKAPDDGGVSGHLIGSIYGLRIGTLKGASNYTITNGWGIYQEGASDDNYFAGKVLIGTATPGGSPVRISGLPTSSAGLSSGDLWNNGGVINIV